MNQNYIVDVRSRGLGVSPPPLDVVLSRTYSLSAPNTPHMPILVVHGASATASALCIHVVSTRHLVYHDDYLLVPKLLLGY